MKCKHGVDSRFCAVCNHACGAKPEPFRGMREDETPRLVKGRDKAEWRGVGQSLNAGTSMVASAAADGSRNGPWTCRSDWGKEQLLRTLIKALR